jgi:hypothetical protein
MQNKERIMKRLLLALPLFVMACTPTYQDELDQKLSGKSPEEKRAILSRECGQQLQDGLKTADPKKVEHYEHMKRICAEMTKK